MQSVREIGGRGGGGGFKKIFINKYGIFIYLMSIAEKVPNQQPDCLNLTESILTCFPLPQHYATNLAVKKLLQKTKKTFTPNLLTKFCLASHS